MPFVGLEHFQRFNDGVYILLKFYTRRLVHNCGLGL